MKLKEGGGGGGMDEDGNPHVTIAEMFFLFFNSLTVEFLIFQEKEKKIL